MPASRHAQNVELATFWARLPDHLRRQIAPEIKRQADGLAAAVKERAPRDRGKLRESVRVRQGRNDLEQIVEAGGPLTTRQGTSTSYDYALADEFGNEHVPARPFFYPTYRARRAGMRAAILAAVERAIGEKTTGALSRSLVEEEGIE